MKHFITLAVMIMVLLSSCSHKEKDVRPTKNLIIMLTDGTSTSLLSASRWYKTHINGETSELNLDPHVCGLVKTL